MSSFYCYLFGNRYVERSARRKIKNGQLSFCCRKAHREADFITVLSTEKFPVAPRFPGGIKRPMQIGWDGAQFGISDRKKQVTYLSVFF